MESEMKWTLETYRLDELERKFNFPCVVCVNEGYYSETDAEGFSQGDILSIDSKMTLHKVAANFAEHIKKEKDTSSSDKDYVELEREILVPMNYKGKLRVLRRVRTYDSVRELANECPRYAKLRENLKVTTEENIKVTIQAGTIIELDRILPGSFYGKCREPDRLVIQFQHSSGPMIVGVPLNERGKFITEPDKNEYTIKEAIERYSLPQYVQFVDDKVKRVYTQDLLEGIENMSTLTACLVFVCHLALITNRYSLPQYVQFVDDKVKRVYTQDLLEGIENMSTLTETLRLNRLVTQHVLVGHYKPLDGSQTKDTERFRQRTLVVLPIDNADIREIEVNVLKGITDDVYEKVFLVRNVSNFDTKDIVDGSLYVDFAMTPGIKIISHDEGVNNEDKPPPRPPKPGKLAPPVATKPHTKGSKLKNPIVLDAGDTKADDDDDDDIYILPETNTAIHKKRSTKAGKEKKKHSKIKASCPPEVDEMGDSSYEEVSPTRPASAGDKSGFSLADMDFAYIDSEKTSTLGRKFMSNIKSTFKAFKGLKDKSFAKSVGEPSSPSDEITTPTTQGAPLQAYASGEEGEEEIQGIYEEINELMMTDVPFPQYQKHSKRSMKKDKGTYPRTVKYLDTPGKPTAHVQPSHVSHSETRKHFNDLNNEELVERLQLCGLSEMADFCKKENLNGAFFRDVTSKHLKEDMNLKGIALAKFMQMKDENWIPT